MIVVGVGVSRAIWTAQETVLTNLSLSDARSLSSPKILSHYDGKFPKYLCSCNSVVLVHEFIDVGGGTL